jgi:catechol 2,3-dioxygenase-like lactoylglutathione lyase family enzyme
MADIEFTGIHHVKLPVSDLARSREWYERVLGFTVEREFPTTTASYAASAGGYPVQVSR